MPIDFYYLPYSPPCRSVLLLAELLGLELNLKSVDLLAGEHLKPEFLKVSWWKLVFVVTDFSLLGASAHQPDQIDRHRSIGLASGRFH